MTHGKRYTIQYRKWCDMKQRCLNPNNHKYPNYGGRGISIQQNWIDDSNAFMTYIESLPNALLDGFSIDRIDNDGNYEEKNLKWSNQSEQSINRRVMKNNKTGYTGISIANNNRYRAILNHNKKIHHIGYYSDIKEAVIARNKYAKENGFSEYIQEV